MAWRSGRVSAFPSRFSPSRLYWTNGEQEERGGTNIYSSPRYGSSVTENESDRCAPRARRRDGLIRGCVARQTRGDAWAGQTGRLLRRGRLLPFCFERGPPTEPARRATPTLLSPAVPMKTVAQCSENRAGAVEYYLIISWCSAGGITAPSAGVCAFSRACRGTVDVKSFLEW